MSEIETLKQENIILQGRIARLKQELSDMEMDAELETSYLESEIRDLKVFKSIKSIDNIENVLTQLTMVNHMKIELLIQNIDKIKLEEFETFIENL